MDLQAFIDATNEQQARDRGNYHLNYGQLIEALKAAPPDAVFDERINGIGSWRGSYTEIALFTDDAGYHVEDEEYPYDGTWDSKKYAAWQKEHTYGGELPKNANELGALLESFIGKDFVGWKGGNFTIEHYKPIWLEPSAGEYSSIAVIGITDDLKLIVKEIED